MLKSLRRYANSESEAPEPIEPGAVGISHVGSNVPPIIWETGNISQIRSLLVLTEAELLLAKAQLTGNDYSDWDVLIQIRDLEIMIADLRRWLKEAVESDESLGY